MYWLEADDTDGGVIAYARVAGDDDPPIVFVGGFTPVVRDGYRIGLPKPGLWRELLNSDAEIYGGSGVGNKGGIHSEDIGFKGYPCSAVVTVPPLGCSIFIHEG
jgi:1,4-alpha-glucan branching enzyme